MGFLELFLVLNFINSRNRNTLSVQKAGIAIKLTFLGTKGEIEEFTPRHQYHASLLLTSGKTRLLIDYGKLRKYTLDELKPDAILITHAHPDPYAWLYEDIKTEIPVYLTHETYDYGKYRPENPVIITPGKQCENGPFDGRLFACCTPSGVQQWASK